MAITIEDHEHRLFLPSCSCSLPKQIADCDFVKFVRIGDGVVIQYKQGLLTADVYIYPPDEEYFGDGVDLDVFHHYRLCKHGLESRHPGAQLLREGMFMVRDYHEERQFCFAAYRIPDQITHLFVRSVLGQFFKIRATHPIEPISYAGVVASFAEEVVMILKDRA